MFFISCLVCCSCCPPATAGLSRQWLNVTYPMSFVICHLFLVMCYMLHVACHSLLSELTVFSASVAEQWEATYLPCGGWLLAGQKARFGLEKCILNVDFHKGSEQKRKIKFYQFQ
jgi:hypothetical protein